MELVIDKDVIDQYSVDGIEFFEKILEMDYNAVLVTDECELSDFCFNGVDVPDLGPKATYKEMARKWRELILDKIELVYGVRLQSTQVTLIRLFEQLRQHRAPRTLN